MLLRDCLVGLSTFGQEDRLQPSTTPFLFLWSAHILSWQQKLYCFAHITVTVFEDACDDHFFTIWEKIPKEAELLLKL